MTTANKARGECALPDAFGKGVFIRFTIDAMERMESEFGDDWVNVIIDGTGKSKVSVFKTVLANTLVEKVDNFDFSPLAGSLSDTRVSILDALFLSTHGRTLDEQMAKEEEDNIAHVQKNLEKMGKDPQMASALLLLQSLSGQGTAQDSAQPKSGALPPEK